MILQDAKLSCMSATSACLHKCWESTAVASAYLGEADHDAGQNGLRAHKVIFPWRHPLIFDRLVNPLRLGEGVHEFACVRVCVRMCARFKRLGLYRP